MDAAGVPGVSHATALAGRPPRTRTGVGGRAAPGPARDPGAACVTSPSWRYAGCALGQGLVMVCLGVTVPLPEACWTSPLVSRPKQPLTAKVCRVPPVGRSLI